MNGHQTRRTLTVLNTCLAICAWTPLQDISSQAKEHWWTEESLSVRVGPAAAGLNQQGQVSRKVFELVWKLGLTFRIRVEINCLTTVNIEHYKWPSIFCRSLLMKYGTEYSKSCHLWNNENISMTFLQTVGKFFYCKSWNVGRKNSIGCREICVLTTGTFLSHLVELCVLGWAEKFVGHYMPSSTHHTEINLSDGRTFSTCILRMETVIPVPWRHIPHRTQAGHVKVGYILLPFFGILKLDLITLFIVYLNG